MEFCSGNCEIPVTPEIDYLAGTYLSSMHNLYLQVASSRNYEK